MLIRRNPAEKLNIYSGEDLVISTIASEAVRVDRWTQITGRAASLVRARGYYSC